jgi:putative ABC transport system substrate-binding protein
MNRRRFLLTSLAGALAAPCAVEAQQAGRVRQVGMINEFWPTHRFVAAFREGLRELGYTEGQNLVVEYRHAHGVLDRVTGFAIDLLRLNAEVLVVGGSVSAQLVRAQTSTVPIVFATSADPVSSGLAASLARPGGNATGISIVSPELIGKQLELLSTAVPKLTRVGALYNPGNPAADETLKAMREAARVLALEVQPREAREPKDIPDAFAALANWRPRALVILADPMLGTELQQIAKLTSQRRLPAIYVRGEFAEMGGFLAYGPSFADNYRRAAIYVNKILRGTRPGDLPVEQPTKFELIINVKTAKALGLTIPPSLLARADQIIE